MECILTTVKRDPNLEGGLRTESVNGETNDLPIVGWRFELMAQSLDKTIPAIRVVSTSPVESITEEVFGYTFTTRNSTYQLEIV
jgi:hypothetical protein|tara:strand:- start:866 stop:1117 length:252 start_codon:yes stop_codon:yes gene_type:complete